MKIAFLLLSGGVIERGAEHAIHLLAEDLGKLGHTVDVYQTGQVKTNTNYRTITIPLSKLPDSRKPQTLVGKVLDRLYLNQRNQAIYSFTKKLLPNLKNGNYDIVVPTDGFWQLRGVKKALGSNIKIVTIGLAGPGWTDADTLHLKPDAFVALSPDAETWAKTINPHVRITTIPLQVDTTTFSPKASPIALPIKPPIIITVAALTAYKRIDTVIRATAAVNPPASLLVLGVGEEEAKLRSLGESLLGNRFHLTHCSYQELPRYYAAADVFTLASQSQEAFGRVLIEAQACGLPVVTTDDPIRRWIVGEHGWYVANPHDTTSYAASLTQALSIGRSTRSDNNVQRFSREKIANEYAALLTSLLQ